MIVILIFLFFCAYFVGGIPSGYWFAKYFFGVDITKKGSKNIGATNVARVLGSKRYFFLIFFLDFFKAYLTLLFSRYFLSAYSVQIAQTFLLVIAVFLLIGNAFSPFLKFRGGKGIATIFGILLVLAPWQILVCFILAWMAVLFLAKRVDVASVLAIFTITICDLFFYGFSSFLLFLIFLNVWVLWRHQENIKNFLGNKL